MSKIYLPIQEVTTDTEVKYVLFDKITQKLTKTMMLLPRFKADFEVNEENEPDSESGEQADGQYAPEFLQKKKQQLLKAIQEAQVSIQKLLQEKQEKTTTQQGTAQKKQKVQQQQSNKQAEGTSSKKDNKQIYGVPVCQSVSWSNGVAFRDIELPQYRSKRWYE